jgi:hypothetical protein
MKLASCIALIAFVALAPPASAQSPEHVHVPGMSHEAEAGMELPAAAVPAQAGQSAFAAVQELAAILEGTPGVDWKKVDFEALRRHLIDMDNVTVRASIARTDIDGGARFTITGSGAVKDSIQRMAPAHAATANGVNGWSFSHEPYPDGAVVTVRASADDDVEKIRGLGFIGLLARGMHHQEHHLMIALGNAPHH